MTTLTAIPQPATASIALDLEPTGTVTQILRTDARGIAPVRTLPGQLPTSSPTVLVDNEAALTGTVTYTVVGGGGASATTALDLAQEWLTVPVTPAWSQQVDAPLNGVPVPGLTGFTAEREASSTILAVIGRPAPLVNLGPLRLRTGNVDVWCPDAASAMAWAAIYDRGEVVLLRQTIPGLDMYHVATRTRVDPDETRWRLSIEYREVALPAGDQVGTLGWSIDDVTATYATVAAVTATYPTVNDLTIGPLP